MVEDRRNHVVRAAEEQAEGVRDSYRAAVERAFEARERHVRLTRHFFEDSIGLLEDHAEANRRTMHLLAEQARERREAFRELSRASLASYSGFLDSLAGRGEGCIEDPEDEAEGTG